jgi:hypothetical protein
VVVGGLDAEAVDGVGDAFFVFDVVVVEVAIAPGLNAFRAGFGAVPTEKPLAAVALYYMLIGNFASRDFH